MCKKIYCFSASTFATFKSYFACCTFEIRQIDGIYCGGIYIWRGERNERLTEIGDFDHIHATSNLHLAATKCAWSFSGC